MEITFSRKQCPIIIYRDGAMAGTIRNGLGRAKHKFVLSLAESGVYWPINGDIPNPVGRGGSPVRHMNSLREAISLAKKTLTERFKSL